MEISHIKEMGRFPEWGLRNLRARVPWVPSLVIAFIGVALSLIAFQLTRRMEDAHVNGVLELRAEWRARDFERKLAVANEWLEALAVFIATQKEVDPRAFHRFAGRTPEADPPNSALIWTPFVTSSERTTFIAASRRAVADDFDIIERTPDGRFVPAEKREEYLPVLFAERFDDQPGIPGFDILSLPERRVLADRARDEGRPIASPPTRLFVGSETTLGFLVFWPVYSTAEVPAMLEERRRMFRGLAISVFHFDRLLPALIAKTPQIPETIELLIDGSRDGGAPEHVATYDPAAEHFTVGTASFAATTPGLTLTREFDSLGRSWKLISHFSPEMVASLRSAGPFAWLLFGLLLTASLAAYTRRERVTAATESEQMARGIIDPALDAFVQMDEAGKITEWNPQAAAIFGWSRQEAIGKSLDMLIVPPAQQKAHKEGLARFLHTGEKRILGKRLELAALRRDGSELKVELAITALRRRSGYLFNAFIRDLTEKIAAEAQLRHAQKMEAIGNLTGGMAHDFNNLLGVIVGNLDMLHDLRKDDAEADELTHDALEAALRGADLTRRLLAFARRQPLQPQRVDVNELVSGITKLLSRTLGENIEISLNLTANQWPIVVDPAQLQASLTNLATNGRDAMPNGGRLIITTANRHLDADYARQHAEVVPGDYVMLEVSDTGTGMTPEVISRIFEPFYTTKERDKGTGLGLSMVFGFMKQSGGHISVYSEPGAGTSFRLYLPRAIEDVSATDENSVTQLARGGDETILAVEDNDALPKLEWSSRLSSCVASEIADILL